MQMIDLLMVYCYGQISILGERLIDILTYFQKPQKQGLYKTALTEMSYVSLCGFLNIKFIQVNQYCTM